MISKNNSNNKKKPTNKKTKKAQENEEEKRISLENLTGYDDIVREFALCTFTRFFYISNTFISNARLELAKNQVNAKQHPEAEL